MGRKPTPNERDHRSSIDLSTIPHGSYKDLVIPYFGGPITVSKVLDTFVSAMLVAWTLFIIIKAMKRVERMSHRGETPLD